MNTFKNILKYSSFEITPRQISKIKTITDSHKILANHTKIYVTCLTGSNHDDTVQTCSELSKFGLKPVPHIAARSFSSGDHLNDFLMKLADLKDAETGKQVVDEALVIAGGLPKPLGPYKDTMSILNSGLLEKHCIRTLGFAGYPEGSPDISDNDLMEALMEKNKWITENENHDAYIVTQFCFDPDSIIQWTEKTQEKGNKLPIQVGLAGPTKVKTLLKYAQFAGVMSSAQQLSKRPMDMLRLASTSPDSLVKDIITYMKSEKPCTKLPGTINGFHFYTFGGLKTTATWLDQLEE